ncbi:hypothetical protein Golob_021987 [Gossypium lobatum]|uniref:Uncharacterized protein n=1 Tax=Gossypium lobatum TaxID=34289 RepID=A0A7J8LFD2_9ROSI|nr:hypothetical protein [Gossypium lobatum]
MGLSSSWMFVVWLRMLYCRQRKIPNNFNQF